MKLPQTAFQSNRQKRPFSWREIFFFLPVVFFALFVSACGSSDNGTSTAPAGTAIERFIAMYTIYPSFYEAQTLTFDYSVKTNQYQRDIFEDPNLLIQISRDQNMLTSTNQEKIGSILRSLKLDEYSSSYTDSGPAGSLDQTYVQATFFYGEKQKTILMNTYNQDSVPSELMDFFNVMRHETLFW